MQIDENNVNISDFSLFYFDLENSCTEQQRRNVETFFKENFARKTLSFHVKKLKIFTDFFMNVTGSQSERKIFYFVQLVVFYI